MLNVGLLNGPLGYERSYKSPAHTNTINYTHGNVYSGKEWGKINKK